MHTWDGGVGQDSTYRTELRNPSECTHKRWLGPHRGGVILDPVPYVPRQDCPPLHRPHQGSCQVLLSPPHEPPTDPRGGWLEPLITTRGFPQGRLEGSTDPGQQYLGCIDGLLVGTVTEQGHSELGGDTAKCRDLVGAGATGVQAPLRGVV